ncbi:undecaprenyldiphospho-muramoylpentapeptide beta-N-acetylglucosaminyltransferase [Porticoccaceae bacterium]|nr:undecaprenyldiphospho-muramoylpentapeptide beta-N-acetylglucosaminyltransferase [Porticoccaceae bacterium]
MGNKPALESDFRVMIMAGGTGGHVFPALAVAERLRTKNVKLSWLGTSRGIESELVPANNIELHHLSIEGIRGRGFAALFKAPLLLLRSISQAFKVLSEFKPTVVLGMGGFASGPGAVAAKLKGIPVIIHEQNSVAGTTNKLSATIAARVMQGFPDTLSKGEWCGNPVRPEIAQLAPPQERFTARSGSTRVLVLGGSRGALAINNLLPKALAQMDGNQRPDVLHQTGSAHWQATCDQYRQQGLKIIDQQLEVVPFIDDMAGAYDWADFVICRSGALTVAELTSAGLGALLIPFPHAIDDHQTKNADWLVARGAAKLLQQSDLTDQLLAEQISLLCSAPKLRLDMAMRARELAQNDAAQRVADVCLEVGYER